jgi:hypothetical protein
LEDRRRALKSQALRSISHGVGTAMFDGGNKPTGLLRVWNAMGTDCGNGISTGWNHPGICGLEKLRRFKRPE